LPVARKKNVTVVAEQLRLAMKSPSPIYSGAALTAIAVAALQGQMPSLLLDGWGVGMLLWQTLRFVLWRRFARRKTDLEVARGAKIAILTWTVTGLLWGLFGAYSFVPGDPEAAIFVLFVVTTNVAAGAVIVSSYLPAHAGYVFGMGVPMMIGFLEHGTRFSLLIAFMLVCYAVLARSAAYFGNRSVVDLIKLKVEKTELVANLQQAVDAADLASRAKSRFLANMTHELRTPLNAIIGFSEVMRDQLFGPIGNQRYSGYVADIHKSGQHLLGIVNDVLDLSKLEAGQARLNEEDVDPVALARECVGLMRPLANANSNVLSATGPDSRGIVMLRADPMRLKQVLLNLLSNAVKFSMPGGKITVTERLDADGGFVISVRDQGIGMDKAGIAIALQPFGQVESEWARHQHGTGLGLPLTSWLTRLHGGRLRIESALGRGTNIEIMLPPERVRHIETVAMAMAAAG
jgi:signal transduction histidine kinase